MVKFLLLVLMLLINFRKIYGNENLINKAPILFSSDNLSYDYKDELLKAAGNVEMFYEKQMIYANDILYNYRLNEVEAIGNIKLVDPNNNTIFANKLFFNLSSKSGYINPFKIHFYDNSRLAALEAKVSNDRYNIKNATYSTCPVCSFKAPEWQIKAKSVTFDNVKKNVTYNNAYFEIYGVPILFIPYFSHPTRDSPAKSGLLNPKLNKNSELGNAIEQPIYFRIADNKELTISPVLNTKSKLFLKSEYNHLINSGLYHINFSYLRGKYFNTKYENVSIKDNVAKYIYRNRGHIETKGLFKISENWQGGHNITYVSDRTYLKTYKFTDADHLTSNIYADYMKTRNYGDFQLMSLRGLNDLYNTSNKTYLLPYSSSHFEYKISEGSYYFFDNNVMMLNEKLKYQVNRVINNAGHKKSLITRGGHIIDLINSIRVDGYNSRDNIHSKHNKNYIKIIPTTQTNWSYPLLSQINNSQIFLKPYINILYTPNNFNKKNVPIEDSLYVELSDDNLFNPNKWPGLDRMEEGLRLNYAFDTRFSNNFGQLDFFLGQSYRHNKDYYRDNEDFIYKSGLYERFSDYVGKINYIPNQYFNVFYKFRIDRKDGNFQKNDLGVSGNYKSLKITAEYTTFNDYYEKLLEISNKQLYIKSEITLNDKWSVNSFGRKNLSKDNKKMILAGGNLIYKGDCIDLYYTLAKDYTRSKEQKRNSVSHFFNISLRNITH